MVRSHEEIPPDVLRRIDPAAFSVPNLIGLVLLDRGAPMTLEEIAARLADLGVIRSVPSLRKTWHALRCLRKNRKGKIELIQDDWQYSAWYYFALDISIHLGDLARRKRAESEPEAGPGQDLPAIDDRTPVRLGEVLGLSDFRFLRCLTLEQRLALIIEGCGGEVGLERALRLLGEAGTPATEEQIRSSAGCSGPVRFEEGGRLVLHPDESIRTARFSLRAIHKIEEFSRDSKLQDAAEREETRRWYRGARKAALRCFFGRKGFGATSVLDPDARTFEDFLNPANLAAHLAGVEVLFGIDPRGDLERLEMDPGRRHLVDLSPPVKTARLNRRGRALRVTPELILRSTLGISRPLGNPAKLSRYLRTGDLDKVFRRLRADLKALWRLYEFGCLHDAVRLEWGSLRGECMVSWNVGRLPVIYEVIEKAMERGELLEAVLGRYAPGWEDPWSRAVQLRVARYHRKTCAREFVAELPESGERRILQFDEIAAIRRFPGAG